MAVTIREYVARPKKFKELQEVVKIIFEITLELVPCEGDDNWGDLVSIEEKPKNSTFIEVDTFISGWNCAMEVK